MMGSVSLEAVQLGEPPEKDHPIDYGILGSQVPA